MGFGKFFGNLIQAGAQTVLLPLDIAKDVVTLGGACTGDEPATIERMAKIAAELEDAYDALDED